MSFLGQVWKLIKDLFRAIGGFFVAIFKFIGKFLGWLGQNFTLVLAFALIGFALFLLYQAFNKTEGQ